MISASRTLVGMYLIYYVDSGVKIDRSWIWMIPPKSVTTTYWRRRMRGILRDCSKEIFTYFETVQIVGSSGRSKARTTFHYSTFDDNGVNEPLYNNPQCMTDGSSTLIISSSLGVLESYSFVGLGAGSTACRSWHGYSYTSHYSSTYYGWF